MKLSRKVELLSLLIVAVSGCQSSPEAATAAAAAPPPGPVPTLEANRPAPGTGSVPTPVPTFVPEPPRAPLTWSVSYRASCSGEAAEACPGAFGFAVASDGTYRLGPGPQGQVLRGKVDPDDVGVLRASLGPAAATPAHECAATGICVEGATAANAGSLREAVLSALARYGTDKFPGPCSDALVALEQAFADVRHCKSDSDCTLIDGDLLPMEGGGAAAECGVVPTLGVANSFDAVADQRALVAKHSIAKSVCETQPRRPYCGPAPTGPARCVSKTCVLTQ